MTIQRLHKIYLFHCTHSLVQRPAFPLFYFWNFLNKTENLHRGHNRIQFYDLKEVRKMHVNPIQLIRLFWKECDHIYNMNIKLPNSATAISSYSDGNLKLGCLNTRRISIWSWWIVPSRIMVVLIASSVPL